MCVMQDTGAWYVDHFDLVIEEYEALGEAAVNALYPVDHTHTSPTGADYVAQAFIRGVLCDSTNPLNSFVTNSSVVPGGFSMHTKGLIISNLCSQLIVYNNSVWA